MGRLFRNVMLAAALLAPASSPAVAQTYPSKPITIVIGYTPGAVSDLAARTIARRPAPGLGPAGDRRQPAGQRRQYRRRRTSRARRRTATR